MKSIFIFVGTVIFSFSTVIAKEQNIKNSIKNSTEAKYYNHQEYLKQQFESQQKSYQIHQKSFADSIAKNTPSVQSLEGNYSSSVFLKSKFYSNELISWIKNKFQWAKHRSAVYVNKLRSISFNKTNVSIQNVPPNVGNIQFRKLGSGVTPNTNLWIEGLDDVDGQIVRVKWTFGDGSTAEMFQGEFNISAGINHIFPGANHFNLVFEAEDNNGAITTKTGYIEFAENSQPTPYFTATPDPTNPLKITFDILSSDPDSSAINVYTLVCPSGGTPDKTFTCTFPSAGNYNLMIFTVDPENAQVVVNAQISIGGPTVAATPVGVIDFDADSGVAPFTVNLDASSSFDIDGSIQSYEWNLGEFRKADAAKKGVKVSKTYYMPGTYYISLKVKDDQQNESIVYKEIHVFANSMTLPEPKIMAMNYSPLKLSFWTGLSSFPMPIVPSQVFWDFGDGNKSSSLWASEHTYSAPGTYNIQLKVIDLKGHTYTTSKSVTIGSSVDSPNSGWISANALIGKPYFNFNYASNASDPQQSQLLTYQWTYFDGSTDESGSSTAKQYATVGYKPIELFVTNSRGISSNTQNHSEVVSEYNTLYPRMTYSPKVGIAPLTVNFDGTGSMSYAGKIVSHQWSINGQVFSTDAVANQTFTTDGTYYLAYIVTDELGNQGGYEEMIVVNSNPAPPENTAPVAVISSLLDSTNNRRLNFNCYSSTDDQFVATCAWKLNGVPLLDSKWGQIFLLDNINYVLELTATDPYGVTNTITKNFNFTPSPIAVIDFDYSPMSPQTGMNVQFGAEQSWMPDGIVSYSWTFGDGATGTGAMVNHVYTTAGTYNVRLTVVNGASVSTVVAKSITVLDTPSTVGLRLSATSSEQVGSTLDGQTYRALKFPETIRFNTISNNTAEGLFHDGVWNFGNGQFGYGENVEYTYFKPGTYVVQYTGKTPSNNTVNASLTIIIPDNASCLTKETHTFCLKLDTSVANILPLSQPSWNILHSRGALKYSISKNDLTADWIKIVATDGTEDSISLSDAITIVDNVLVLSREKLLQKNINLGRSYKIKVSTKSRPGGVLIGDSPEFYFGSATLNLSVSDIDAKLELVHPGSQLRQYFDLQGTNSKSFSDLPAGTVSIIAKKGEQTSYRTFNLLPNTASNFSINLEQAYPIVTKRKPLELSWMSSMNPTANPPSWTQGLCGEPSPFKQAAVRTLGAGEVSVRSFTSINPSAQSTFVDVNRSTSRNMVVSCAITSPALMYAQNKWKYKEGPSRCFDNPAEHPLWKTFLNTLNRENSPVILAYEIKDQWTNQTVKGHFVTSAKDVMTRDGLTLDDLTGRIGLGTNSSQDFAQRANFNVKIPTHFRRPQVLFHLVSDHNSSNTDYYSVSCDVIDNVGKPAVSDITATSMNYVAHSSIFNARVSLTKGYNFFPVQYDNRATAATTVSAEAAKVKYKVIIQRLDYKSIEWQAVDVDFKYGTQTFSKRYLFTGTAQRNNWDRTYTNTIDIDTADLYNQFVWEPGVKNVNLVMKPVGKEISDYDFTGEAKSFAFVPLFDLQTVKNENSQICTEGFYQNPTAIFVRDELIQDLIRSENFGFRTRCGDASAPFGGLFELNNTWKYNDHRSGNSITIRSFNDSGMQDSYDNFQSGLIRQNDVNEYMNFSQQAKAISLITDEYDIHSQPTSKKLLYDFCHPTSGATVMPCQPETTFASLDHDMVLQICQWNIVSNTMPAGCPSVDMSKIFRYSKWVEKNANQLKMMNIQTSIKMNISSGNMIALSPAGNVNWQQDSLVYGLWPDAKPIWQVNTAGDAFLKARVASCHQSPMGCFQLNSFFQNDDQFLSQILLRKGWN